jgi:hypothetical protein
MLQKINFIRNFQILKFMLLFHFVENFDLLADSVRSAVDADEVKSAAAPGFSSFVYSTNKKL